MSRTLETFLVPLDFVHAGPTGSSSAGESHHRESLFPPPASTWQGVLRTALLRAVPGLDLSSPSSRARAIPSATGARSTGASRWPNGTTYRSWAEGSWTLSPHVYDTKPTGTPSTSTTATLSSTPTPIRPDAATAATVASSPSSPRSIAWLLLSWTTSSGRRSRSDGGELNA